MINILEILKKIPNLEDYVFYSPLYGDVKVEIDVTSDCINIIRGYSFPSIDLNRYGKYCLEGELMLYPSRENRDWSTFKIPRKDLPKGTNVMVSTDNKIWALRKYAGNYTCYFPTSRGWEYIVPVSKFDFDSWTFNDEDNYGLTHKK